MHLIQISKPRPHWWQCSCFKATGSQTGMSEDSVSPAFLNVETWLSLTSHCSLLMERTRLPATSTSHADFTPSERHPLPKPGPLHWPRTCRADSIGPSGFFNPGTNQAWRTREQHWPTLADPGDHHHRSWDMKWQPRHTPREKGEHESERNGLYHQTSQG